MAAPGPVKLKINPYMATPVANVIPGTWTNYGDYTQQGPRQPYVAPDLDTENGYIDEFGWADGLLPYGDIWGTPDAQRLNTTPQYDFYQGTDPVDFFEDRDDNTRIRHSEEIVDGNGWQEEKGFKKVGLFNPREYPPPE
jgi:hypothetical protein